MSSPSSSGGRTGTYRAVRLLKLSKTMEEGIAALELQSLPSVPLQRGEVRVQVHASALNYFDLLMLQGRYQYRPQLPFTVGSEAAGVVIEVGPGVSRFRVGDAVIAGMTSGNAVASEMVMPESLLIRKPPQFTMAEAAGFPVGFFTTWHALVHRGNIKKGEVLLVTGAGGGMVRHMGRRLIVGPWLSAVAVAGARRARAHTFCCLLLVTQIFRVCRV